MARKKINKEQNQHELLRKAREYCEENDKSTEFMLQYMQDVAGCDLNAVLRYLEQNKLYF